MTIDCATVRDLLPSAVRDELRAPEATAVAAHTARCAECAAEAELVRVLAVSAPAAPADLAARVRRAWLEDRRRHTAGWRAAALAATVAAAILGGRVLLERSTADEDDVLAWHSASDLTAAPANWAVSLDPLLRDAAALEPLSVEELELVLRELEP